MKRYFSVLVMFLLCAAAYGQQITVKLTLEDGRLFTAKLDAAKDRSWARFHNLEDNEQIMGARMHKETDGTFHLSINNGVLDKPLLGDYYNKGIVRFKQLSVESRATMYFDDGPAQRKVLYNGVDIPWLPRRVVTVDFNLGHEVPWQLQTDSYGPAQFPIRVATEAEDLEKKASYLAAVQAFTTGIPNSSVRLNYPKLGPWMPPGEQGIMEPGGTDIEMYPDPASRYAVKFAGFLHARWQDRSRDALYFSDGRRPNISSFTTPVHYVQIRIGAGQWELELPFFTTGDWEHTAYRWFNGGPKDYDATSWKFAAEVTSHSVRCFRHGVFVYNYTRNQGVREDLLQQYEARRFEYSERSDEIVSGGGYIQPSLSHLYYQAQQAPHTGIGADRAFGWYTYLTTVANWMGENRLKALNMCLDTIELAALSDNGVVHVRDLNYPWMPPGYRGEQFFHNLIIYNADYQGCKFTGRTPTAFQTFVRAHFDNPDLPPRPYFWGVDQFGPPWWIAVYKDGQRIAINDLTSFANDANSPLLKGDPQFNWHILTECYLLTGDLHWLYVSLKYYMLDNALPERYIRLQGLKDNNWCGLQRAILSK